MDTKTPASQRETQTVKIPEVEETTVISTSAEEADLKRLLEAESGQPADIVDHFGQWWSRYRRILTLLSVNAVIVILVIGMIWNVEQGYKSSTADKIAEETASEKTTESTEATTPTESSTSEDILAAGQETSAETETTDTTERADEAPSTEEASTTEPEAESERAPTVEEANAAPVAEERVTIRRQPAYPEQAMDWNNPYNSGGPLDLDRHEVRTEYLRQIKEAKKGGKKTKSAPSVAEYPTYRKSEPVRHMDTTYDANIPTSRYVEVLDGEAARDHYKKMNRQATRKNSRN